MRRRPHPARRARPSTSRRGSTGTPYNWVRGRGGARPRPPHDRLLRPLRLRRRAARRAQRLLDGRLGHRPDDGHRARGATAWSRRPARTSTRSSAPWRAGAGLSVPDRRLPAVPEAAARRGRRARLRLEPSTTMHALLGGEGNSEALRDYLLRRFRSVLLRLRRDRRRDRAGGRDAGLASPCAGWRSSGRTIAEALFGEAGRGADGLPVQPAAPPHRDERRAASCCSPSAARRTLSPKVRYNVHDEGGVLRDDELRARLAEFGITPEQLSPPGIRPPGPDAVPLRLRPQGLDRVGHGGQHLSGRHREPASMPTRPWRRRFDRSACRCWRSGPGEPRPLIDVELVDHAEPDATLEPGMAASLASHLLATNTDYRGGRRGVPGPDGADRQAAWCGNRAVRRRR